MATSSLLWEPSPAVPIFNALVCEASSDWTDATSSMERGGGARPLILPARRSEKEPAKTPNFAYSAKHNGERRPWGHRRSSFKRIAARESITVVGLCDAPIAAKHDASFSTVLAIVRRAVMAFCDDGACGDGEMVAVVAGGGRRNGYG